MSRLTNGIGPTQLSAGGSSALLVQPATSDPVEFLRIPAGPALTARRGLATWMLGPRSVIAGVTKNSAGAALASVVVKIYATATDTVRSTVTGAGVQTSDAGGAYGFEMNDQTTSYVVAYKAGSPDVAGTTRNDLVGT